MDVMKILFLTLYNKLNNVPGDRNYPQFGQWKNKKRKIICNQILLLFSYLFSI